MRITDRESLMLFCHELKLNHGVIGSVLHLNTDSFAVSHSFSLKDTHPPPFNSAGAFCLVELVS